MLMYLNLQALNTKPCTGALSLAKSPHLFLTIDMLLLLAQAQAFKKKDIKTDMPMLSK